MAFARFFHMLESAFLSSAAMRATSFFVELLLARVEEQAGEVAASTRASLGDELVPELGVEGRA